MSDAPGEYRLPFGQYGGRRWRFARLREISAEPEGLAWLLQVRDWARLQEPTRSTVKEFLRSLPAEQLAVAKRKRGKAVGDWATRQRQSEFGF